MSVFPIGKPFESDPSRIRSFWGARTFGTGPVIYVCDREFRAEGNRALFFAAELAVERAVPLVVAAVFDTSWAEGNFRHLFSVAPAVLEMSERCLRFAVPVFPFFGDDAGDAVAEFLSTENPCALTFDFHPLKSPSALRGRLCSRFAVPAFEIDSRTTVPVREVSQKAEIGARTLRPKFWKAFVEPGGIPAETPPTDFPPYSGKSPKTVADAVSNARCDRSVPAVEGAFCSQSLARKALSEFVASGLFRYAASRNDPNSGASSGLSFQFRNGTLSSEEVVLAVRRSGVSDENVQAFLEEFLIRRELSENFCLYRGDDYDSIEAAPAWALSTLRKHASDARDYRYSFGEFESAATHDDLWNACQNELVTSGKIAPYLRMYWAKKILEWSLSPEEAYGIAMTLNDRYALDGRSPNGYVWVLWAIAGLHDRPWFERGVFWTVRYMNRSGCERKFDVPQYVRKWGR